MALLLVCDMIIERCLDRVDNARTTRRRTTSEASRPEAVTVEHEAPAVEEPEIRYVGAGVL